MKTIFKEVQLINTDGSVEIIEEEDNWYSGFSMPSTANLIEGLMELYYKGGAKKILVNIPTSLLLTLADVRTQPKYRWRNIGKAKKMTIPWF